MSNSKETEKGIDRRDQFLLKVYEGQIQGIDRHISGLWESCGLLAVFFAGFYLNQKNFISLDVVFSAIILVAWWQNAHVYCAHFWFNRNINMMINIERMFLDESDLKDVHYYFGKHRGSGMLPQLHVQLWLGKIIGTGALVYVVLKNLFTFIQVAYSTPTNCWIDFCKIIMNRPIVLLIFLPITCFIVAVIALVRLKKKLESHLKEFEDNSPGKEVNTEVFQKIRYGSAHGHKD